MYLTIYKAAAAYIETMESNNKRFRCDNFNINIIILHFTKCCDIFSLFQKYINLYKKMKFSLK